MVQSFLKLMIGIIDYESNDYAEKETSYYIAACYKPLCIQ